MGKKVTNMNCKERKDMLDKLRNNMDKSIVDQLEKVLRKENRNQIINEIVGEDDGTKELYEKWNKELKEANDMLISNLFTDIGNEKIDDILNEEDTDSDAGERFE